MIINTLKEKENLTSEMQIMKSIVALIFHDMLIQQY